MRRNRIRGRVSIGSAACFLALGFLGGLASDLVGQVNTERLRRDSLPAGISGSITGAVSLHSGNVEFALVELGGRLDLLGESGTTFLVGRGDLGFQDGDRFTKSGMLHLRRVQGNQGPVALELFGQVDHDRSRRLSFRALAGAGPRFLLVDGPGAQARWGVAYMFEHERLELLPEDEHAHRTSHHRLTTYVTANAGVGQNGAISATIYAQPRFDEWGDVRVLAETRLSAGLSERLALTVSWNLRHDSRPPEGVTDLDTTLRTGLAVALGGGG